MKKRFLTLVEVLICFSLVAIAVSPLLFFLQFTARKNTQQQGAVENHKIADSIMKGITEDFYRGAVPVDWIDGEKTFSASKWQGDAEHEKNAAVVFKSRSKPLEKEGSRRIYLVEVIIKINPLAKFPFEKRFFLPCIYNQ